VTPSTPGVTVARYNPAMSSSDRDSLLALLHDHAPADPAEAESLARIRALVRETPAPFERAQAAPGHLTASAVVVDPERRRAALILHRKLRLWLQPGGHFEPGERDPLQAAIREAREEIGVEAGPLEGGPVLLDVDVHTIPARPGEPAHEHFDLRFLLVARSEAAHAGDGADAFRWVTPAEAAALDLDPGLRRALAKVPWRG
jgi:8-oxo-dGTP pyrophosphatase MutT (NUDIX family)